MFSSTVLQEVLAWIVTYAVHSTVLLGLAFLVTKFLSDDRLRWKERIWKTAMFGALFSASLQAALEITPLAGRLEWTHVEPFWVVGGGAEDTVLSAALAAPAAGFEFTWERLILGVWVLGGLLGLALFLFAWRQITDRLAGRVAVRRGEAKESLQRLAKRAGLPRAPRLCVSKQLKSPATVGVFFPQICVPARALVELSSDQQEALLAHELAHILRRDPAWFFACGIIERLFFFQVLNRVARRELQEIAEYLSDDWAAQNTKDELGLARCLTEVATWVLDLRPVVAVVPMASRNSRLGGRIARLLDDSRVPQDHGSSRRAMLLPLTSLSIAALCLPAANALSHSSVPPKLENPWSTGVQHQGEVRLSSTMASVQPAGHAAPTLDGMLTLLDSELESLYAEVENLHAQQSVKQHPNPHPLAELHQRVQSLRDRHDRLRTLLPALRGQAPPFPTRNPKQEESK